jgi:hypothetical protein
MADALNHPHPDVPFSTIGDDTIMVVTTLAAILKNKFKSLYRQKSQSHQLRPLKINTQQHSSSQLSHPPVKHNYHTRPQIEVDHITPANVIESQISPQLLRVVTQAAICATTPRVMARARNLSPRNFSQGDFLDMGSVNADHTIAFGNIH